jgi:hypothetical protein
MIGTIMAIASGVMSGAQAINNFQKAKKAEKQAMVLGNQMNAMKIKDVYGSLQAPDIAQAAYDQTARAAAQANQALQGMGPEGAAQVANLNQSVNQANLDAAQAQAQANFERDQLVAQGRNQNAQYEYANKMDAIQSRLEGAQGAATAGRENAMASIAGGIEGIGSGLAYDYGNADKVWGKEKTTNIGNSGESTGNLDQNKSANDVYDNNPVGDVLKMKGKDRKSVKTTTTAPLTGMYSSFQFPQNIG